MFIKYDLDHAGGCEVNMHVFKLAATKAGGEEMPLRVVTFETI